MTLPIGVALAATQAQSLGELPRELEVVIDSRALRPGQTYLALRGERFDGHDFVGAALRAGARAVVVDDARSVPAGSAALVVADTKAALLALAAAARRRTEATVVAITGSAGKTTTKAFLAHILDRASGGKAAATPENENNEIGVAKLLLALPGDLRFVVVEMGARAVGDISLLVGMAQPDIGVLTNIGEAHLGIFGSREKLAAAKWSLFERGARAVLNAEDERSMQRAATLAHPPWLFGTRAPQNVGAHLAAVVVDDDERLVCTEGGGERSAQLRLAVPGRHNRANLAAAAAAALAAGVPFEDVVAAANDVAAPPGRYETFALDGGARIIFDGYNASPAGMCSALETFAHERARRRIAVLASMAELGAAAPEMHERVGAAAAQADVDVLLVGGEYGESLAAGARAAGLPAQRIVAFSDNAWAADWLRENAASGDAVLLKGSRVYHLEQILEALRSAPQRVPG